MNHELDLHEIKTVTVEWKTAFGQNQFFPHRELHFDPVWGFRSGLGPVLANTESKCFWMDLPFASKTHLNLKYWNRMHTVVEKKLQSFMACSDQLNLVLPFWLLKMMSVTDTVNVQLLPCPPGRASFAFVYWDAVYGIHLELWFTEGSEWRKLYLKTQSKKDIDPNFGGSVKKHWTWQEVKSSQIPFIYWIYTILRVFSEERWIFSDVVRHPRYNFFLCWVLCLAR